MSFAPATARWHIAPPYRAYVSRVRIALPYRATKHRAHFTSEVAPHYVHGSADAGIAAAGARAGPRHALQCGHRDPETHGVHCKETHGVCAMSRSLDPADGKGEETPPRAPRGEAKDHDDAGGGGTGARRAPASPASPASSSDSARACRAARRRPTAAARRGADPLLPRGAAPTHCCRRRRRRQGRRRRASQRQRGCGGGSGAAEQQPERGGNGWVLNVRSSGHVAGRECAPRRRVVGRAVVCAQRWDEDDGRGDRGDVVEIIGRVDV